MALYLMSNQDATMIGLYRARLSIVRERIGTLSGRAVERALVACGVAEFADYDLETEHVWVREMAKFRLGLHNGPLKRDDNRARGALHLYQKLAPNPFLGPFFKRYRTDLHLPKARAYKGTLKPIASPLEAPSKPVFSIQYSESSIQESGDQDPGKIQQLDQEQRADAHRSHRVLVKLAHEVLTELNGEIQPPSELMARLKDKAAQAHIPYDSREAAKALDSAEHTHAGRHP
jgi:hypothetical protein